MKPILLLAVSAIALAIIIPTCNYLGAAKDAVMKEVNPHELNRKYEWFKDSHARLTALQQQVITKQAAITAHQSGLSNVPRERWNRDDIQILAIANSELAGIKATFNNLAAEYNSEMSKFHTAFTNAGQMPEGSTLPKNIIQYTN